MKRLVLIISTAILMTGCATTPDPAKVCSAEWIEPRAEKAVNAIEKDTRGVIRNLRKVAASYVEGKTPGPLELFSLTRSVGKLENELESGRGIRDLRMLSRTCDDPKIISGSMARFMRSQGLPEKMVNFIENLDEYQKLLAPDFGLETRD